MSKVRKMSKQRYVARKIGDAIRTCWLKEVDDFYCSQARCKVDGKGCYQAIQQPATPYASNTSWRIICAQTHIDPKIEIEGSLRNTVSLFLIEQVLIILATHRFYPSLFNIMWQFPASLATPRSWCCCEPSQPAALPWRFRWNLPPVTWYLPWRPRWLRHRRAFQCAARGLVLYRWIMGPVFFSLIIRRHKGKIP